jgi:hypothetical protein
MDLNDLILSVLHDAPAGQPLARVIDSVLAQIPPDEKAPSTATVRRRIDRLGAMGHLYLKKVIVVYPKR